MLHRLEQDADPDPIVEPIPDCLSNLITAWSKSERSPVSFALRHLLSAPRSGIAEAAADRRYFAVTIIKHAVTRTHERFGAFSQRTDSEMVAISPRSDELSSVTRRSQTPLFAVTPAQGSDEDRSLSQLPSFRLESSGCRSLPIPGYLCETTARR